MNKYNHQQDQQRQCPMDFILHIFYHTEILKHNMKVLI